MAAPDDHDELFGMELPPGFRFHPTDEEIIMHYLIKKVMDRMFRTGVIGEADFNKCEPWDLPKKAKMGEKEWFLFCQRDKKYPTGMRTNRATESGYWKATGKDKEIYNKGRNTKCLVGMKKTLVFYLGRAPKGEKTSWIMHEYRLEGNFSNYNISRAAKEEWVVCKVFYKNTSANKSPGVGDHPLVDHLLDSPTLPPLADYSCPNERPRSSSFAADDPEVKGNISLNDHKLQVQHDHQKNFFHPHPNQNYTLNTNYQPNYLPSSELNPVFFSQNTPNPLTLPYQTSNIRYQYQEGMMTNYPTNFPFKGVDQMRHLTPNSIPERMCKAENFSCNNSVVSHSQDTGVSTAEINNEITSVNSRGANDQSKSPFDQEFEGIDFSSDMPDLDSFWSY